MKLKVRNIIAWAIPLGFFCWAFYVAIQKTIENSQLTREGHCTNAYVLSKKNIGAKGVINVKYQFNYNGITYYGNSQNNDNAEIGDSITIVFLESDPQINRSNSFLKKECP